MFARDSTRASGNLVKALWRSLVGVWGARGLQQENTMFRVEVTSQAHSVPPRDLRLPPSFRGADWHAEFVLCP